MNNPQLSRKEEIQKGCGEEFDYSVDINNCICGHTWDLKGKKEYLLCPTCQARLDERIKAEQDFLRLIDELQEMVGEKQDDISKLNILKEELKSTIQKETKE